MFILTEDVIPFQPKIVPNGTYVIRKGRDRKHVFDIPEFVPPPPLDAKVPELRDANAMTASAAVAEIESVLESSQELLLSIEEPNDDIPQPPINIPKYRHSIDLALPSMQSSIHSTKYALLLEHLTVVVCQFGRIYNSHQFNRNISALSSCFSYFLIQTFGIQFVLAKTK